MTDMPEHIKILTFFVNRGYEAALKADLGQETTICKDRLRKEFESNEEAFNWAMRLYIAENTYKAEQALHTEGISPTDCLLTAFMQWAGRDAYHLHQANYGRDIIERGLRLTNKNNERHVSHFEESISDFLFHQNLCSSKKEAEDTTFLLMMSSKGLLLKCEDREDYRQSMYRIIHAALNS
ncbi:hypothetical protein [Curvivirga aplysinae]|uniref:hypothetical protein n=1 Tax=Curvivirga aplysinae TaxID=2529852 RepID=UPI0012BC7C56|nr:hypothetical protein [Curvivirga aplysinae]MTI10011.1 hypothetical protein [Curvivirga aplysinae]